MIKIRRYTRARRYCVSTAHLYRVIIIICVVSVDTSAAAAAAVVVFPAVIKYYKWYNNLSTNRNFITFYSRPGRLFCARAQNYNNNSAGILLASMEIARDVVTAVRYNNLLRDYVKRARTVTFQFHPDNNIPPRRSAISHIYGRQSSTYGPLIISCALRLTSCW